MTFYAYIHSKPDGTPFYVGKGKGYRANDFNRRNQWHQNTVNKIGKENVLISKIECSSERIAFDLEIGLIKTMRANGIALVNLTDGGEGSSGLIPTEETRAKLSAASTGRVHSAEARKKLSKAKKGMPSPNLGKFHSKETKAKISASRMGKAGTPWSDESKAKLSASIKGKPKKPLSEEAKRKISVAGIGRPSPMKGKTFSEEVRRNMSEAHKGKTASDETRAKMSAAHKERHRKRREL